MRAVRPGVCGMRGEEGSVKELRNHEPGNAKHFWCPVDPSRRVDCECKSGASIARRLGVSKSTAIRVIRGERWK